LEWIVDYFIDPEEGPTTAKYENHKAVLINLFGKPNILINSPESVHDILQTKNKLVDKTGDLQFVFEDLLPTAFVF
jgi:hypothetical protein